MKKIKLIISLAVVGLMAGQAAQAVSIVGEIFFSSTTGSTLTPGGSTPGTATGVSFGGAAVDFGTGVYLGLGGTAATFSDFTFGSVGTTGPNSVIPLWEVNGAGPVDYTFELTHITVNTTAGTQRNLEGHGIAKIDDGAGTYDDTAGYWTMNFSGSSTTVSFSSYTASVPDTGSAAALLGIGLLGLAGAARRFKK